MKKWHLILEINYCENPCPSQLSVKEQVLQPSVAINQFG